jgi:hypothetical protein
VKKGFFIGAVCGGVLGVIICLSMDLVLGEALGGGWREAVAHDLGAIFGSTFDRNSFAVLFGVFVVIGFVAAFGALIGGVFGVMVTRLLSFLTKEE